MLGDRFGGDRAALGLTEAAGERAGGCAGRGGDMSGAGLVGDARSFCGDRFCGEGMSCVRIPWGEVITLSGGDVITFSGLFSAL